MQVCLAWLQVRVLNRRLKAVCAGPRVTLGALARAEAVCWATKAASRTLPGHLGQYALRGNVLAATYSGKSETSAVFIERRNVVWIHKLIALLDFHIQNNNMATR